MHFSGQIMAAARKFSLRITPSNQQRWSNRRRRSMIVLDGCLTKIRPWISRWQKTLGSSTFSRLRFYVSYSRLSYLTTKLYSSSYIIFHRFQGVQKWFRPKSRCFKLVLIISKCFEKFCDHFASHFWWFHTFKMCQISVSDAFSKLQKPLQKHRHLHNARCLPNCPFRKLGSRMDAPIFRFGSCTELSPFLRLF